MKHNRMIAGILALILAFGSGGCSSGPDAVSYTHLTLPTIA